MGRSIGPSQGIAQWSRRGPAARRTHYNHDFDDPNFTLRYDCVPIMQKNSHIQYRVEECSDHDDDR